MLDVPIRIYIRFRTVRCHQSDATGRLSRDDNSVSFVDNLPQAPLADVCLSAANFSVTFMSALH